ncbi:MAG: SDR family oxidoreductase, partial [Streptosporangiaceae bacterium]
MITTGVAVVTGAGSGLGREITRALLGAGWRVAAASRREDALRDAISAPGLPALALGAAVPVATDVTDAGSVAALFETVRGRWGRVDLLVNNAGIFGPGGAVDEISLEDWRRAVDTNLTGAFL